MKAIIFDLDGTLLDSLQDLWLSTNHALGACGMPQRSLSEVRRFVGNGVGMLIHRAVPEGTKPEVEAHCLKLFRQHYVAHCQDHTCPYDGVNEMLEALAARGLKLGIVSNKLQAGVTELWETWFRESVTVAVGEGDGLRRKPSPDMVNRALSILGVKSSEAIYVGDSDVDLLTARQANMPCISVLWGFRSREFLLNEGATMMVNKPDELVTLIDHINESGISQ